MLIVGHNLASDYAKLIQNGYRLPPHPVFDTEVASRWVWPDEEDHSLEHLALTVTSMGQWRKSIKRLKMADFEAMSDDELAERCGGDAEATVRLYEVLKDEITAYGLNKIFGLAMDVLPILAEMGGWGMALDHTELCRRAEEIGGWPSEKRGWLGGEKVELERILKIENLNSHEQVAKTIFGSRFRAEPLHRTTKGFSSDKKSLMWARYLARQKGKTDLAELLSRLLEYSAKSKTYSTYYRAWLNGPSRGERVHANYSLSRTSTGRLSSFDENLQNVPDEVRELVVPSSGYDLIVQADFKQLELAIAAHVSQDPTLLDWIRRGLDIHSLQASRVLGLPEPKTKQEFARFKEKYPTERQIGKRANFSCLYGVMEDTFSWQIFQDSGGLTWVPPEEGKKYIDTFFKTFQGYQTFINELWKRLCNQEWIVSDTGRRWFLPADAAGWRKAQNYPVQSLASDITLLAVRALYRALKTSGMVSRIIGEVHDSIVLETTWEELKRLVRMIRRICENPHTKPFGFTLSVPLTCEIKGGESWGRLVPIEELV